MRKSNFSIAPFRNPDPQDLKFASSRYQASEALVRSSISVYALSSITKGRAVQVSSWLMIQVSRPSRLTGAVFSMAINVRSLKSFNVSQTVRCYLRYHSQSCNFGIFPRIEETDLDWDVDMIKVELPELIKKETM